MSADHSIYDAIYLSPHLDDAALSCGGQIFERTAGGQKTLIVNIMAGLPPPGPLSDFALSQHQSWQLVEDAIASRRAEDEAAVLLLGAESVHWDVPDCIYRRHPADGRPLYASEEALFGQIHPAEAELVVALSRRLATLPPAERIYAPLAVGQHVDHQLVRRAAEACHAFQALFFYEDYPYIQRDPASLAVALEAGGQWTDRLISMSEAALKAKIAAIACYGSQIGNLFGDLATMSRLVRMQTSAMGGERLWQRHL